jgi:hypothetical protein
MKKRKIKKILCHVSRKMVFERNSFKYTKMPEVNDASAVNFDALTRTTGSSGFFDDILQCDATNFIASNLNSLGLRDNSKSRREMYGMMSDTSSPDIGDERVKIPPSDPWADLKVDEHSGFESQVFIQAPPTTCQSSYQSYGSYDDYPYSPMSNSDDNSSSSYMSFGMPEPPAEQTYANNNFFFQQSYPATPIAEQSISFVPSVVSTPHRKDKLPSLIMPSFDGPFIVEQIRYLAFMESVNPNIGRQDTPNNAKFQRNFKPNKKSLAGVS